MAAARWMNALRILRELRDFRSGSKPEVTNHDFDVR
jgi:hypothetical protein